MTAPIRTVHVDRVLQRELTNDATLYTLTRPLALVAYIALLAAAVFTALTLPILAAAGSDRVGTLQWTMLAIIAFIVASILFTRASTRRAIAMAMPLDSTVRVEVGPETLLVVAKHGSSELDYAAFRSVHAGRHAVLLRLRSASSVVTAIPRALVSDEEIAFLKRAVG